MADVKTSAETAAGALTGAELLRIAITGDNRKLTLSALMTWINTQLDPDLVSIAALTGAADRMLYATGASTWALAVLTAAGRALLDDADAAAQRTTLGLGSAATVNTGTSGATIPLLNAANVFSALQALSGLQLDAGGGTAPATAGATGTAGMIRWDASFIYVCTATNTWKRVAIATW